MKIATTTGDFKLYCQNDIERINELNKAGFKYIDLDMYSFTAYSAIGELVNPSSTIGTKRGQARDITLVF